MCNNHYGPIGRPKRHHLGEDCQPLDALLSAILQRADAAVDRDHDEHCDCDQPTARQEPERS